MAKKKRDTYTKVSDEELEAVQGIAGAKVGLSIAAQMELLKAKTFAIPMLLGSIAGMILPGKETKKKLKGAIKMVKEANVSKAEIVYDKLIKEAIGPAGIGTIVLMGGSLAPKPRQTATSIATTSGTNIAMKKLINLPRPKL
jgi:hypothetical protein